MFVFMKFTSQNGEFLNKGGVVASDELLGVASDDCVLSSYGRLGFKYHLCGWYWSIIFDSKFYVSFYLVF